MTARTAAVRSPNFPQRAEVHECLSGENFSLARVGASAELARYGVTHPLLQQMIAGKVFLKELLGLSGMEISFGLMPARTSIPFYHKHQQNEEAYLFLSGEGEFQVDERVLPISEGTAIRVSPEGVRAFRNTSDQAMFYIVIQAKQGSLENWTGTDGVGVPGSVTWPA